MQQLEYHRSTGLFMARNVLFSLLTMSSFFMSCNVQDCHSIEDNYATYVEFVRVVRQAKGFAISEKVDLESDWMKEAEYYSCDGEVGFFIYTTKQGKTYIHEDLPLSLWEGFISASSHGSYYVRNIKGRYHAN